MSNGCQIRALLLTRIIPASPVPPTPPVVTESQLLLEIEVVVAVGSKVNQATRPDAQPTTTTEFISLSPSFLRLSSPPLVADEEVGGVVAVAVVVMRFAASGPKHEVSNAYLDVDAWIIHGMC